MPQVTLANRKLANRTAATSPLKSGKATGDCKWPRRTDIPVCLFRGQTGMSILQRGRRTDIPVCLFRGQTGMSVLHRVCQDLPLALSRRQSTDSAPELWSVRACGRGWYNRLTRISVNTEIAAGRPWHQTLCGGRCALEYSPYNRANLAQTLRVKLVIADRLPPQRLLLLVPSSRVPGRLPFTSDSTTVSFLGPTTAANFSPFTPRSLGPYTSGPRHRRTIPLAVVCRRIRTSDDAVIPQRSS